MAEINHVPSWSWFLDIVPHKTNQTSWKSSCFQVWGQGNYKVSMGHLLCQKGKKVFTILMGSGQKDTVASLKGLPLAAVGTTGAPKRMTVMLVMCECV